MTGPECSRCRVPMNAMGRETFRGGGQVRGRGMWLGNLHRPGEALPVLDAYRWSRCRGVERFDPDGR